MRDEREGSTVKRRRDDKGWKSRAGRRNERNPYYEVEVNERASSSNSEMRINE
jgi:hypothetical protein